MTEDKSNGTTTTKKSEALLYARILRERLEPIAKQQMVYCDLMRIPVPKIGSQSRLLNLPAEIRSMIWKEVMAGDFIIWEDACTLNRATIGMTQLDPSDHEEISTGSRIHVNDTIADRSGFKDYMAILRVNHQTYREVKPLLINKSSTYHIQDEPTFVNMLQVMPSAYYTNIASLIVHDDIVGKMDLPLWIFPNLEEFVLRHVRFTNPDGHHRNINKVFAVLHKNTASLRQKGMLDLIRKIRVIAPLKLTRLVELKRTNRRARYESEILGYRWGCNWLDATPGSRDTAGFGPRMQEFEGPADMPVTIVPWNVVQVRATLWKDHTSSGWVLEEQVADEER